MGMAGIGITGGTAMKDDRPIEGFSRFEALDQAGRSITYYADGAPEADAKDQPPLLAVSIQGSGCDSVFRRTPQGIGSGHQGRLRDAGRGRYRTLVVEKPGVSLFDESEQPGTSFGCSPAFLQTFTLDRWGEAIRASVEDFQDRAGQRFAKTLLVGHSEGGQVAPYLCARHPWVTHVALIGAPGTNQILELAISDLIRSHSVHIPDATRAVQRLVDQIYGGTPGEQEDRRFELLHGHTYGRWRSFLQTSPLSCLMERMPHLYIAHGISDEKVSSLSSTLLFLELMHKTPRPVLDLIEDVTHGVRDIRNGEDAPLRALLGRIADWFVGA
ncbi:hypothetical protein GCM10011335_14680 [Aureimonas glaciei]|uniref:Uncharacterized protein n=2 Tax=Aureimonas glaciei TaxID=1776957 RepID=A0A917D8V5_9HYPH|nr:hypothetical protein GCM10011335_14680 [Aureimonas glaciei]